MSGCTAVTCIVDDNLKLYVANAGDSRIIMSTNGEAKAISVDHKPSNEVELRRIINAGGYVEAGRVNGNLALSRAFGDLEFKKNTQLPPAAQAVTVDPELFEIALNQEDDLLVLACDGTLV
jgi:protein phosphatase 2C family protein 2/3